MKSIISKIMCAILLFYSSCENATTVDDINLSLSEQNDWVYASAIVEDINSYRNSIGKPSVRINCFEPSAYAIRHNLYMVGVGAVSHDYMGERSQGIKNLGGTGMREIVAFGFYNSISVVRAWLRSDSHRTTIEGDYNQVGIAVNKNDQGVYYFTVIFFNLEKKKYIHKEQQ